jgi:GTP-binding protein HflX
VLLSDTVGFIRELPHQLIASFKATLEEARQADLLLHVADVSSPTAREQIAAVHKVLEELGIQEKDLLLVLNKIDAIHEPGQLEKVLSWYPSAIPVSARSGEGLSRLANAVSEILSENFLDVDVVTGVDNGRLMAYLAQHGEVLSRTYTGDQVSMHCRVSRKHLSRIQSDTANILLRPSGTPLGSPAAAEDVAPTNGKSIEDVA